jgi:ABC-type transport system involved in multi-copper enzyme maturation permease subunit
MLSLTDVFIIARHEVATTLRGRKGVVLAVTLFLLVAVPALLRLLGQYSVEAIALQRAHTAALVKMYDRDVARLLLDCPAPLVVVAIATFFCQPLFVLIAGSDRVASEIESGGIRYWTVRAPRIGIILGRAVGLWMVVSLVTGCVQAAIAILAVVEEPRAWLSTLGWAARIVLSSSASALVYASLCTFLEVAVARSRWILLAGLTLVLALRMARSSLLQHGAPALASLFPGALDELFLSPSGAAQVKAIGVVALWSLAFLGGAVAVFRRRTL